MPGPYKTIEELLFEVPQYLSTEEWKAKRAAIETYIAALIERNFARLLEILYRVDINEMRIKTLLADTSDTNSATLITNLIIERQLQKLAFRQSQQPDTDIPEQDRW
jgi:hypothetical protein